MNVNLWGPALWDVLHWGASIVNEKNYIHFITIMYSLNDLLPCIHCLNSYRIFFKQNLPVLQQNKFEGREYYMKYVYDLHNLVNEKLANQQHRTSVHPSFDIVIKRANLNAGIVNEESIWRSLFAMSLAIQTQESYNALKRFAFHLSELLMTKRLVPFFTQTWENSSEKVFLSIANCKYYNDIRKSKDLYTLYATNLPARCNVVSCS